MALRRHLASAGLLGLGAAGLAGTVNAARPARGLAAGPSWFGAFLTTELAPQLALAEAAAGAALVAAGGAQSRAGKVGLAALAATEAAAIPYIVRARRTVVDLEGGEETELGLDQEPPGDPAVPYPRRHMLFPWEAWTRDDVRVRRGIVFAQPGRQRLKLDVWEAREPPEGARDGDGRRPAIVQIHGGAWVGGTRHEQGAPLLGHLAANGWVGFNADYRLSPRATWPDQVADVKRAIAWVREHAGEYGVDPRFIAITGGSAGGHLAALAALTHGDPEYQPDFEDADTSVAACVPFYGIYDLVDDDRVHLTGTHHILERAVFKTTREGDPGVFRAASPLHRVREDAPPFLVVHGTADSLVPVESAHAFVARLRSRSRSPVLYAEMKGGQHAFDILPSFRTIPVIEAIERFLARQWAAHRAGAR